MPPCPLWLSQSNFNHKGHGGIHRGHKVIRCPARARCANVPAGSSLSESRMRRAIYPGSFDPVTNGHLDIIERGSKLFDEIIIAVLVNPEKRALFTVEERREMLEEVLTHIESGGCRLRVGSFQGLLMRYAVEQQADAVVRGIRAISDYEYELQMALMNRRQEPRIETVFMLAAESYSYVSSRLVKEVYSLGGTIEGLVPATVEERMRVKLGKN